MKVYENHPYAVDAPLSRFMAVFWASPSSLAVTAEDRVFLSLTYDGKTVRAALFVSGEELTLSGEAAAGDEVIFTKDGARVALYAEGRLCGEGRFRAPLPEGGVAKADKLFHLIPEYAYSAGWESLRVSSAVADLAAFCPCGGGTVTHAVMASDRVFYRTENGTDCTAWGLLQKGSEGWDLLPAVTSCTDPGIRSFGVGAPLAAYGGLYFFCPVSGTDGNGYVSVFVSKDGERFSPSPLRLCEGAPIGTVDVCGQDGDFVLRATWEDGTVRFLASPDLYHWDLCAERKLSGISYRRLSVTDGQIEM